MAHNQNFIEIFGLKTSSVAAATNADSSKRARYNSTINGQMKTAVDIRQQ